MKFPENFVWGTATSSYQIEGAYKSEGRGPSIWDAFSAIPGKTVAGANGNVAIDHYNRMRSDIALMAELGFKAYRFSIAWPRIVPDGKSGMNEQGMAFYSTLIDELLAHGIEPWVTLYHWDLPLNLQLHQDGWLSRVTIDDFVHYADCCFKHLGDRVTRWITFNEPWVVSVLGHGLGAFAPGRTSSSEPYQVAHHLLLAHARTVARYREQYAHQQGLIGPCNNFDWREPLTQSQADRDAAQLAREFFYGWFTDPVVFGDYPAVMRERVGDRLPAFTDEESRLLKGSWDFLGLNHYTTQYVKAGQPSESQDPTQNAGLADDQQVTLVKDDSWSLTQMQWGVVPWGIQKALEWIDDRYGHPAVYVTENGFACDDVLENGEINDQDRLSYYQSYIAACYQAIENGVDLRGYFAWSCFDNFEWASGYGPRFGLVYIDYENDLKRIPKASARWFGRLGSEVTA